MIDPFLKAKADKLASGLSNAIPIEQLNAKYAESSDEEKKEFDDIQKRAVAYFKANDMDGLQKYLKHLKAKK